MQALQLAPPRPADAPALSHRVNTERLHQRVMCEALAYLGTSTGTVRGKCRDVSVGGMFFEGPGPRTAENAEVVLFLKSGGMLRIRAEAGAPREGGIGLRFIHFEPPTLRGLMTWMAGQER